MRIRLILIGLMVLAASCAAPARDNSNACEPLVVGSKAPDFWMKNQEQQRVSLSSFAGRKNVILVFFPLAFTPV